MNPILIYTMMVAAFFGSLETFKEANSITPDRQNKEMSEWAEVSTKQ